MNEQTQAAYMASHDLLVYGLCRDKLDILRMLSLLEITYAPGMNVQG